MGEVDQTATGKLMNAVVFSYAGPMPENAIGHLLSVILVWQRNNPEAKPAKIAYLQQGGIYTVQIEYNVGFYDKEAAVQKLLTMLHVEDFDILTEKLSDRKAYLQRLEGEIEEEMNNIDEEL